MTKQEIFRLFYETFNMVDLGESKTVGDRKILIQAREPRDAHNEGDHEFMAIVRIPARA